VGKGLLAFRYMLHLWRMMTGTTPVLILPPLLYFLNGNTTKSRSQSAGGSELAFPRLTRDAVILVLTFLFYHISLADIFLSSYTLVLSCLHQISPAIVIAFHRS